MFGNNKRRMGFTPSWEDKEEKKEETKVQNMEIEFKEIIKELNLEHLELEKELHEEEVIRNRIKKLYSKIIEVKKFIQTRNELYGIYNSHIREAPEIALEAIEKIEENNRNMKMGILKLENELSKHITPETTELLKEVKLSKESANQLNIIIRKMMAETNTAIQLINQDESYNNYTKLIRQAKERMEVIRQSNK